MTGFITIKVCDQCARLFLLTLVLIAGCARQADERQFEVGPVDTNWSGGRLNVTVHQKLKLSREAREALVHGVPLTLQLELLVRSDEDRVTLGKSSYIYEISYLPLIGHYQLTQPSAIEIKVFPRLRYLLAELSTVRQSFNEADLPEGSFELMARTQLDQRKMPTPMRLPMLFSSRWRHNSGWTIWPVEGENGS
jgi:hypothetical protein